MKNLFIIAVFLLFTIENVYSQEYVNYYHAGTPAGNVSFHCLTSWGSNDDLLVIGWYDNTTMGGTDEIYVARIDDVTGNLVADLAISLTGITSEVVITGVIKISNEIVMCGYINSSPTNALVMRYNLSTGLVWMNTITTESLFTDIVLQGNGNFLVSGGLEMNADSGHDGILYEVSGTSGTLTRILQSSDVASGYDDYYALMLQGGDAVQIGRFEIQAGFEEDMRPVIVRAQTNGTIVYPNYYLVLGDADVGTDIDARLYGKDIERFVGSNNISIVSGDLNGDVEDQDLIVMRTTSGGNFVWEKHYDVDGVANDGRMMSVESILDPEDEAHDSHAIIYGGIDDLNSAFLMLVDVDGNLEYFNTFIDVRAHTTFSCNSMMVQGAYVYAVGNFDDGGGVGALIATDWLNGDFPSGCIEEQTVEVTDIEVQEDFTHDNRSESVSHSPTTTGEANVNGTSERLCIPTRLGEDAQSNRVEISNPESGTIIFTLSEFDDFESSKLIIFDLLGRVVTEVAINSDKVTIQSLLPGLYIYGISNGSLILSSGKVNVN